MKATSVLFALLLATWSLAVPAVAIQQPPDCVRQGPPCGPEPLPYEIQCLVGDGCFVSVETYVCVTDPCPGIMVCIAHRAVCLP